MTNLTKYFKQAPLYDPPMMQFDGSTGFYEKSYTSSGNKITVVCRFSRASFTGGGVERLFRLEGPTNDIRAMALLYSSDNADADRADKILFQVQSSAAANLCLLITPSGYLDGEPHTIFFSFDGDAGAATLYIDGTNADDTGNADRVAPTTGTLESGASSEARLGADAAAANPVNGEIGFFGCRDAYLTNWSDFMDVEGKPQLLDQFGWTQWGGGAFGPASQLFDGSTGYFNKTFTCSGNKVCGTVRFKQSAYTGGGQEGIVRVDGGVGGNARFQLFTSASDHATADYQSKLQFFLKNSAGTIICRLISTDALCDGAWHTVVARFDGDTGAAEFIVDGVDADDTGNASRVAPTTGTLESGAAGYAQVGRLSASLEFGGELSFIGYKDQYALTWGDFMDATGAPKEIDELNWTEWGGQPLFWNKYGAMDDNQGSAGNMTRNGTVTHTPNSQPLFWHEAAKMDENLGSAGAMTENGTIKLARESVIWKPDRGKAILTPGTATATDMRSGVTAWVNGVQLQGARRVGDTLVDFQYPTGQAGPYTMSGLADAPIWLPDAGMYGAPAGGITIDADGYGTPGYYVNILASTSGNFPAKTKTARVYQMWGKTGTSLTSGRGMRMIINRLDNSNYYLGYLIWNGTYPYVDLASFLGGVYVGRVTTAPVATSIGLPFIWNFTMYDYGDRLVVAASAYETDTASDGGAASVTWQTASRSYKDQTSFIFQAADDVANEWYVRGARIFDI